MIVKQWAVICQHIQKFLEISIVCNTHHGSGMENLDKLKNTQHQ